MDYCSMAEGIRQAERRERRLRRQQSLLLVGFALATACLGCGVLELLFP